MFKGVYEVEGKKTETFLSEKYSDIPTPSLNVKEKYTYTIYRNDDSIVSCTKNHSDPLESLWMNYG